MSSDKKFLDALSLRKKYSYKRAILYGGGLAQIEDLLKKKSLVDEFFLFSGLSNLENQASENKAPISKQDRELIKFRKVLATIKPDLLVLGQNEPQPTDHWFSIIRRIKCDIYVPLFAITAQSRFFAYTCMNIPNTKSNWTTSDFLEIHEPFLCLNDPF